MIVYRNYTITLLKNSCLMAENFNRSWHGENCRVSKPPLVQRCSLPTNTKPLGRPPLKSRTSFHFQEALKEESETSKVSKRTLTRLPSKQGSLNRKANFTSRPHLSRRVTCQNIFSDSDLISRVNLTRRTTFSHTPKCKVCLCISTCVVLAFTVISAQNQQKVKRYLKDFHLLRLSLIKLVCHLIMLFDKLVSHVFKIFLHCLVLEKKANVFELFLTCKF